MKFEPFLILFIFLIIINLSIIIYDIFYMIIYGIRILLLFSFLLSSSVIIGILYSWSKNAL